MIECSKLACPMAEDAIGQVYLYKNLTMGTSEAQCHWCGFTWKTDSLESNLTIDPQKWLLNFTNQLDLVYKKILYDVSLEEQFYILDDEFVQFINEFLDKKLMLDLERKVSSKTELIIKSHRISFNHINQVETSLKIFDAWIRRSQFLGSEAQYVFPVSYVNPITREVWELIKYTNEKIQILDTRGNQVAFPKP